MLAKRTAVFSALLVLAVIGFWLVAFGNRANKPGIVVSYGQNQVEADFARSRGYIRYRIAGTGKRYWYSAIADRFGVAGGWKGIAAATLDRDRKGLNSSDLEKSQFKLETGQEVRIPIQ
ncbi:MAG: hypothetical protein JWM21_2970 [Acidobacteria bacterium]|nr:hypothetical protein [Acidobacteriota bacterium]